MRAFDAFENRTFDLRVAVLWCIHDYPAYSTMSGRTTQGYPACLHCDKDPLSYSIKHKLCYIGHHRFLPPDHLWWTKSDLRNVHEEKQHQPESFAPAELEAELEKVRHIKPGIEGVSHSKKEEANRSYTDLAA